MRVSPWPPFLPGWRSGNSKGVFCHLWDSNKTAPEKIESRAHLAGVCSDSDSWLKQQWRTESKLQFSKKWKWIQLLYVGMLCIYTNHNIKSACLILCIATNTALTRLGMDSTIPLKGIGTKNLAPRTPEEDPRNLEAKSLPWSLFAVFLNPFLSNFWICSDPAV